MSKKNICHAVFMIAIALPILSAILLGTIQFGPQ